MNRRLWLALVATIAAAALVAFSFSQMPKGFLPQEDQGYFFASVQLPEAASLERTEAVMAQARELLADLLGNDHDKHIMAERHLLAMLANAPSPAGVDGLEVVGYVSQDDIKWQGDCTLRLKPYSDYTIPLCRLSDAQAIIDGMRDEVAKINSDRLACWAEFKVMTRACLDAEKERDQQAQRIGELEGLLLRVQVSLSLDDTEWGYSGAEKYKLLADIRAALSAGKEGE